MNLVPHAPTTAHLGHYLTRTPTGFVLHMSASPRNLRAARGLTHDVLHGAGVEPDAVDGAQLVLAELYGNALHACGDFAPLVAEVEAGPTGVWVRLHDPDRVRLPRHTGVPLDDPCAESGRGSR
ncbi:ATP-binding protein [Streptomyces sp. G5(2025)]|uniref:ATP-binding protein n=1 Tax=Streptomyces sp. G5(2025) TaxID=3406628 RepID=UPI003C1B1E75